jgi:hypothetical protein
MPDTGGLSFGEQYPTQGEVAVSWQTWDNGSGSVPTIMGDADWGTIRIVVNEQGRSKVYAFSDGVTTRSIWLTANRYSTGLGFATLQIRGASWEFTQDDNTVEWEDYVGSVRKTWKYVQMRVINQE